MSQETERVRYSLDPLNAAKVEALANRMGKTPEEVLDDMVKFHFANAARIPVEHPVFREAAAMGREGVRS